MPFSQLVKLKKKSTLLISLLAHSGPWIPSCLAVVILQLLSKFHAAYKATARGGAGGQSKGSASLPCHASREMAAGVQKQCGRLPWPRLLQNYVPNHSAHELSCGLGSSSHGRNQTPEPQLYHAFDLLSWIVTCLRITKSH